MVAYKGILTGLFSQLIVQVSHWSQGNLIRPKWSLIAPDGP